MPTSIPVLILQGVFEMEAKEVFQDFQMDYMYLHLTLDTSMGLMLVDYNKDNL